MNRYLLLAAITLMGSINIACTVTPPILKASVSTYHTLPESTDWTSYSFVPLNGQAGSLEYAAYQDLFRAHLAKYNYVEAAPDERPQLLVSIGYQIGDGQQRVSSTPDYGQTGTMVTGASAGGTGSYVSTPTYGPTGHRTQSHTVYTRQPWLGIAEANQDPNTPLQMLYEGTVKSTGSGSHLSSVMDDMADALFKEFPGKNGDVRTEIINTSN